MSETSQLKPYDWLKTIPSALLKEDGVPLISGPIQFPWEKLVQELQKNLQISSLNITPSEIKWRSPDELIEGFGDRILPINLVIPSLNGTLTWIMAEKHVRSLMSALLSPQEDHLAFIHPDYVEGFYQFVAQEVLYVFNKLLPSLSPTIMDEQSLPKGNRLSIDLHITLSNETLLGRLLISPDLRVSWMETQSSRSLEIPDPLAEKIFLELAIEAGRTTLSHKEWKLVAPGDLVILDECSLIPGDEKGRVMLTLNGAPFFRAKIKQGNLKLLEHPLHYEVDQTMGKQFSDEDDDFDLHESEIEEDDFHDEDSDFEDHDEETDEHDYDESLSDLEEDEEGEEESLTEDAEKPEKKEVESTKTAASALNFEEIPLSIIVEVGRLQISIKKLTELQPGNLLELDVRPEDGVDLVVRGKRIARGELLRIGDILGVRILDIG